MKKKIISWFLVFSVSLVVFLVPINAEETGSPEKYIITNDDTGEEIGRFGRFDETFLAVGNLGKGKYTVTLYEDDLDMGSWGGISYGHQVTLKSSKDGPFTIYNRRESNLTNTQRHFSQVAGDLILENIILDGGGVGGGMFVMPGNATMPSSLTLNDGAIIQNCVGVLSDASAIRTIGDNATVIMNGGAIRNNIASRNGGGISVTDGNTLIMNGGTISGNIAQNGSGGGVLSAGKFVMNGGTIENNKAPNQYGGGFAVTSSSDFEFNGGTIKDNEASQGGGVYIEKNANNKSYTMKNANVLNNTSVNSSGGVYTTNPLTILDSMFIGNKTEKTGGGIAAYAPVTIKNSTFKDNLANEGGGLFTRYAVSDNSVVEDSTFEKNSAKFGGAIENWNVTLDVKNSTFNENYATSNGGAIYVFNLGKANLYSSRFEENVAEKLGGAIYTYDLDYNDPVDVTKYQNIVLDDENYFDNNVAIAGLFQPPVNADELTNLKFSNTSITGVTTSAKPHILNNYDINFVNEEPISIYKLTYDANGGKGSFVESVASNVDAKIKTNTEVSITRENYEFIEWNTQADGKGTTYNPQDTIMLTEDITLYAQWEKNIEPIESFTVTYTDGTGNQEVFNDDIHSDVVGGSKTPEFRGKTLREGYTFKGWDPVVSETVTKEIVYVAQWEKKDVPVLPGTGINSNVTGSLLGIAGILFFISDLLIKKLKINKE